MPCTATLLGLGSIYVMMRDISAADEALARAHAMDSQHPDVWAWLALAATAAGRLEEFHLALGQAREQGLQDAELIGRIAVASRQLKDLNGASAVVSY